MGGWGDGGWEEGWKKNVLDVKNSLRNSFIIFRFAYSCRETLNISTICSFLTANKGHLHYGDVRIEDALKIFYLFCFEKKSKTVKTFLMHIPDLMILI